jgi:PEP-CTERM motif
MKKALLSTIITLIPTLALAAPITYNFRDPAIELIDDVNSFSLTQDGLTATLTALPTTYLGNNVVLNQTSSSFGVNVLGTTCNNQEDSATIDGGCTGESINFTFDSDVWLNSLFVSSFGTSATLGPDLGQIIIGATLLNITSTGTQGLSNIFLAAGDAMRVAWVSGNGFSLDNLTVTSATPVPEPTTMVLLGTGLATFALRRRRTT